jgi:cytosine/adenosine deaminase-related metal-dependent hydrolase
VNDSSGTPVTTYGKVVTVWRKDSTGTWKAATWNPARALGWSERTGTIAVGLDADLVLLDANPLDDIMNTARIRAVVRAGRLLNRTTLDSLLAARDTSRGRSAL